MRIRFLVVAALSALFAGCSAPNPGATGAKGIGSTELLGANQASVRTGISALLAARIISDAGSRHTARPDHNGSWIKRSKCGKSVIFSSDYVINTIDIYPQNAVDEGPCGQLTVKSHLSTPQGLFVDAKGDLWVTNSFQHEIAEFAPLSKRVLRTLYDTLGEPVSVVVDPNSGSVYAGNLEGHNNGPGAVVAFDNGSDTPTRQLSDATLENAYFIAVDNESNVYATLATTSGTGAVHEWLGGTGDAIDLGISLSFPGGIETTENGDLLICDQGIPTCGDVEPGTTTLTNLFATNLQDPIDASLDASGDTAFTPDTFVSIIYAWQYPGPDGNPLYEKTVGIPSSIFVAAYPAAPIGMPFNSGSLRVRPPAGKLRRNR